MPNNLVKNKKIMSRLRKKVSDFQLKKRKKKKEKDCGN